MINNYLSEDTYPPDGTDWGVAYNPRTGERSRVSVIGWRPDTRRYCSECFGPIDTIDEYTYCNCCGGEIVSDIPVCSCCGVGGLIIDINCSTFKFAIERGF